MAQGSALDRVLRHTNLSDFYPQKLEFQTVMAVRSGKVSTANLSNDPFHILRSLIMLDFNVRDKVQLGDAQATHTHTAHVSKQDGIDALFEEDGVEASASVHPSDLFYALFQCCTLNLRQIMFQKMFTCKMALPIFTTDPLKSEIHANIWPLRPIIIEWCDSNNEKHETPCVDVEQNIVTFIRIGNHLDSKSNIMNQVLSETHHNCFYNKTCFNSTNSRLIDGFVEGAWFVPAKPGDFLPNVTLFLNLRGDARNNRKMTKLMSTVSSVVVVAIDIKDLDSSISLLLNLRLKCPRIILWLFNKTQISKEICKEILKKQRELDLLRDIMENGVVLRTDGNETKAFHNLKSKLQEKLAERQPITTLWSIIERCQKIAPQSMTVDENTKECEDGKQAADAFLLYLDHKSTTHIRTDVLPLQGNEWVEYSRLLKEERRVLSKSNEDDSIAAKDKIQRKREKLRDKQHNKSQKSSDLIKLFINKLAELIYRGHRADYFLTWLKLQLDTKSRNLLPGISKEYNKAWHTYRTARDSKEYDEDKVRELANRVKKYDAELSNVAIGIEHIFREIGQLYECYEPHRHEATSSIQQLPLIMATLMTKGHTFEIMDGDSSNIPSVWVNAVLDQLETIIGDKKVFVISILGVQSSGKSTLLNTMFGVQFSVSAGRCTKGVFAQLLPVDKTSKPHLKYDYVLVVDTEGLQAPELSFLKHEHDNELAALALGIADVSIVNIKGENTNDMRDTLQIAMHAFLRMKMAGCNLRPKQRCVFVHNNVSALSAKDKTKRAQQKLEDTLDTMIGEAAQEVKCTGIRSFREVLDFDGEQHVWFLSDLFLGDPPMAPINPGYASKVAKIKQVLIEDIAQKYVSVLRIKDVQLRLADLWNAILAEDFIFSFKNSLEAKAYESVLQEFLRLKRRTNSKVMQWVSVEGGKTFTGCNSSNDLPTIFSTLCDELEKRAKSEISAAQTELEKCFYEGDYQELKIQWKESKLSELDNCSGSIIATAQKRMEHMRDVQHIKLITSHEKDKYQEKILHEAKKFAQRLRAKNVSDHDLAHNFDEHWLLWSKTIPRKQIESVNIIGHMIKTLGDAFPKEHHVLDQETRRISLDSYTHLTAHRFIDYFALNDIDDADIHLKQGRFKKWIRDTFWTSKGTREGLDKYQKKALEVSHGILQVAELQVIDKTSITCKFQNEALEGILVGTVIERIKRNNDDDKVSFEMLPSLSIKLALQICRLGYPMFAKQQRLFDEKHSVAAQIEELRDMCFNVFKNAYYDTKSEIVASDMFSDLLKAEIKSKANSCMPDHIVETMVPNFGTKNALITRILSDLLEKNKFDDYIAYINEPSTFASSWISKVINEEWFTPSALSSDTKYAESWLRIALGHLQFVRRCVEETMRGPHTSNVRSWMVAFCEEVSRQIPISASTFNQFLQQRIKDMHSLSEHIDAGLTRIETELRSEKADLKNSGDEWDEVSPSSEIMDQIWGCTAQCPFCHEPCSDSTKMHYPARKHQCVQHRPEGINGWHNTQTDVIILETCSFLVNNNISSFYCFRECRELNGCSTERHTHEFRKYPHLFKEWHIHPIAVADSSPYWCFFMNKHHEHLLNHYSLKAAEIPWSWTRITKEQAKNFSQLQ